MHVDLSTIQSARKRISKHILKTPFMESPDFAKRLGLKHPVYFKVETLQHTGSFKVRGAANKILLELESAKRPSHIYASSAGNHAQAVAYIATKLGIPTTIVMPEGAPLIKVSRTASFGAKVILHGLVVDDSFKKAQELHKSDPNSLFVHPYDDEAIVSGQGSLGLEIDEQLKELGVEKDVQIVVPIGGGGLFGGTVSALKALRPGTTAYGVVAEAAPAMADSFAAGKIVAAEVRRFTLADGLAVKSVSQNNFSLIQKLAEDVVKVSEGEIAHAISLIMESRKLITEGAGAAGVAAVLGRKLVLDPDKPVVFVLCGGNIDVNKLSQIIERGLLESRRWSRLGVMVEDHPGQLAAVALLLAKQGANILEVFHNRTHRECPLGQTYIEFHLETKGLEHARSIEATLRENNYFVEVIDK